MDEKIKAKFECGHDCALHYTVRVSLIKARTQLQMVLTETVPRKRIKIALFLVNENKN